MCYPDHLENLQVVYSVPNLQISMQCWCSLLLHPSLQFVKLSPSTISSKQIGHTSSSSRGMGNDPPKPDELGDEDAGFS